MADITLVDQLISEFEGGREVLKSMSDETYAADHGKNGSFGAHFRHIIEVAEVLFSAIESGAVDYNARERNATLESNRDAAAEALRKVIRSAKMHENIDLSLPLSIRSEVVPTVETASSVGRELEYLISHTVHHHALIAERLRSSGIEIDPMFGVAASTKRHWANGV